MAHAARRDLPWLLWPFAALWDLLAFLLKLTGRVIGAVLGLVLMIVGTLLAVTVLGAPIGIPLSVLGLLLLIRSIL